MTLGYNSVDPFAGSAAAGGADASRRHGKSPSHPSMVADCEVPRNHSTNCKRCRTHDACRLDTNEAIANIHMMWHMHAATTSSYAPIRVTMHEHKGRDVRMELDVSYPRFCRGRSPVLTFNQEHHPKLCVRSTV
jgi:hypothetical protein